MIPYNVSNIKFDFRIPNRDFGLKNGRFPVGTLNGGWCCAMHVEFVFFS